MPKDEGEETLLLLLISESIVRTCHFVSCNLDLHIVKLRLECNASVLIFNIIF